MIAQSDSVLSRVDSSGKNVVLIITASNLDSMKEFSATLQAVYGNFVEAQNHTTFEVSQTESTASCAKSNSWTAEQYNPISDTLSTWTQILIIPRPVFFGPLDDGISASFAALIFGCASALFLNMYIPRVEVNVAISSPSSATSETDNGLHRWWEDGGDNATITSSRSTSGEMDLSNSSFKLSNVLGHNTNVHEVGGRQEYSVVLMSQDPESMSSILTGDVSNFHRLHRFSWLQLQPTVIALKVDPDKADSKLIDRAAEYAILAVKGYFVYTLALTEQRYGRDSVQSKLFRWLKGSWAFGLKRLSNGLFLLAAFMPTNSTEQRVLDIIILTVITCFTTTRAFYQWVELNCGGLRVLTWVQFYFLGLAWVALVLQQLGIVSVFGLMRPWTVLLSSQTLQGTLMVFSICVGDISTILAFAFFSVCTAGVTLLVLYKDRLDTGGTTLDTFVDSFVATFIFMESADNWESLVYNAYKVSKVGAVLLFVVAVFGTFFLVPLAALRVST